MLRRLIDEWRADRVRRAAARWIVRMHGPDAFRWRARFERWREADTRHDRAYDRQLLIWRAAPGLRTSAAAPAPRRTPVVAYALAASVAAAFGLAGASSWFWRDREPDVITAEPDRQRSLRLEDGSRVMLAGGSSLEVALDKRSRRMTLLRGRARFDIRRDERLAIVRAGPALARTAAATMDVRLEGGEARIILLAGQVQLARFEAEEQAGAVELEPGQAVDVGQDPAGRAPRPATSTELVWPSAMISFDDAALADVVERANAAGFARIELGDPSLKGLRVTGAYRIGDNEGLARSLAASLRLKVVRLSDGGLRLIRSR